MKAGQMMRQLAVFTVLVVVGSVSVTADGQQSGTLKKSVRTVKFAAGETVIESGSDTDHVIVKDSQGNVTAESHCDSGSFDAYVTLFTKLRESLARGDRSVVVKLADYPLRVNSKSPLSIRDQVDLSKSYDKVFTPQVLEKIRKAEPAAVFCRDGLGMLGDGVVWAIVSGGTAKATVINP